MYKEDKNYNMTQMLLLCHHTPSTTVHPAGCLASYIWEEATGWGENDILCDARRGERPSATQ